MDSCQAEVDNLGGLAAGPEPEARHKVSFLLNQRHRLFEEDNLFLCRATVDLEQESLGVQFSGTQLACRITPRQFWRLFAARNGFFAGNAAVV